LSSKDIERCESELEDAENTARIGNFGKAAKKYLDAVEMCRKVEWEDEAAKALFLSYLYPCNQDVKDRKDLLETGSLINFVNNASTLPPMKVVAYMPGGLYGEFDTSRILTEAKGILYMNAGLKAGSVEEAVGLLEKASECFLQIGGAPLFFSRYISFLKRRTTGNHAALECEGQIEYINGRNFVEVEPPKAVEYLMAAAKAFRAAKLREVWQEVNKLIRGLRATRKCWMCGREVQGANHFNLVKADVGCYFEKILKDRKEDLRAIDGLLSIALCRPCYTSIYYEADRIAKMYYDMAMQAINELAAEVRTLAAEVRRLASYAHSHY